MLDVFQYGEVTRISPEAPIPILKQSNAKIMLGGCGNVALNIQSLGGSTKVVSVVGNDSYGKKIFANMKAKHLTVDGIIVAPNYKTTIKTRYCSQGNQILRVDDEQKVEYTDKLKTNICEHIEKLIPQSDIIILSDYDKGVLTAQICQFAIKIAKKYNKKVIVDPKGTNYSKYNGSYLVKPNFKEFCQITKKFNTIYDGEIQLELKKIVKKHNIDNIVITLGKDGAFIGNKCEFKHVQTAEVKVCDVSGAGDTMIATLALCLATNMSLDNAVKLGNQASGIVVQKPGTSVVSINELENSGKILLANQLFKIHLSGKTIGFTNGCFDCCHYGHIQSLKQAKKHCDILVVGINSDKWIKKYKGKDRPIQDEKTRVEVIQSFEFVDYVILFDSKTPLQIVKKLKPDVIMKQGYSIENWPEARYVQSYGGNAIILDTIEGYSTTNILERMRRNEH